MKQQIQLLQQKVAKIGSELEQYKHEQEKVSLDIYSFRENNEQFEPLKKQNVETHPGILE